MLITAADRVAGIITNPQPTLYENPVVDRLILCQVGRRRKVVPDTTVVSS